MSRGGLAGFGAVGVRARGVACDDVPGVRGGAR